MAVILDFKPPKKPVTNAFFIDYEPAENCCNDESYDSLCVKCGKCGRKFVGGVLEKGGE